MTEPTVLVVNDDAPSRYLLAHHLKSAGFQVLEAETGEAALDFTVRTPLDVIVLDVKLPGISGYEVARRLRRTPATAGVGLVFVSAAYTADDVRSQTGESDAYLPQPFDAEQLVTTVRLVLARRRGAPGGASWLA